MKAHIEIFTSPACPHCSPAKNLVKEVVEERGDVEFVEMNVTDFEGNKKAKELGIMSVPTLIITGPGTDELIGISSLPSKKHLNKSIDIAIGKDKFEDKKEGFFKRLFKKSK